MSTDITLERRHQNSIAILQRCSGDTGDSVYDHLAAIIRKILDERPKNVADYFEEFSRRIRKERFQIDAENITSFYRQPIILPISKLICANLKGKELSLTHNILRTQFHWSLIGIGMPLEKTFQLAASIQSLIQSCSHIKDCRFWGKIFGLNKNYYIVESVLTNQAIQERVAAAIYEIRKCSMNGSQSSRWSGFSEIQMHKTYFVCNSFTDTWTELPPVTPSQIQYSRQVAKFLTGNLDFKILSYPQFDGTERNLLRALIARISAGTQIAPVGYRQNEVIDVFTQNSVAEWMHLSPDLRIDGSIDTNCTKLISCSKDVSKSSSVPIWTDMNPNNLLTPIPLIALRSNLWPGAFTFAANDIYDNIYIGWGTKAVDPSYNPPLPLRPEKEYSGCLSIREFSEPVLK